MLVFKKILQTVQKTKCTYKTEKGFKRTNFSAFYFLDRRQRDLSSISKTLLRDILFKPCGLQPTANPKLNLSIRKRVSVIHNGLILNYYGANIQIIV